jgi:hypothetical protein
MVYADWLQSHGHPLGEIMSRALAGHMPLGIAEQFAKKHTFVTWERGLWYSLRFFVEHRATLDELASVFDADPCVALAALHIEYLGPAERSWMLDLLDAAARHDWARDLETLQLGGVGQEFCMTSPVVGDVGRRLGAMFPRLHMLRVCSHIFELEGLSLPDLLELRVETCEMTSARARAVMAAHCPDLQQLVLWFGDTDATVRDLDFDAFPKLTSLGLCNCAFTDEIVARLPTMPIAARLRWLDLSLGTLSDDGALALVANAAKFPHLEHLIVDHSYLRGESIGRLEMAFPEARFSAERQRAGPRYVAIAE